MNKDINLLSLYNYLSLASRTFKMQRYLTYCNINQSNFSKYIKTADVQYVSVDKLILLYTVLRIDSSRLAREWI